MLWEVNSDTKIGLGFAEERANSKREVRSREKGLVLFMDTD